jgi:hypothetical protein
MKADTEYSEQETEQRLQKTLRAAFRMNPTPLKDIRKKNGKSRSAARSVKAKNERKP